ncbi:MAG: [FeFe] hydrogenase H-cluster radical SAM maturase HydE [Elusimicrobiota bacterium]|jgi:biotin synthase
MMDVREIEGWLLESAPECLAALWAQADAVRRRWVGDEVHLRGLVEISNRCVRACAYCGLRAQNQGLIRYTMSAGEILDCAVRAAELGYGTVVLQAGEDPALRADRVARIVRRIKSHTPLAVTLSLGERSDAELRLWRDAGADRYLLRFETSDQELYRKIHPDLPGRASDRMRMLRYLRDLGYEVGSGVMIGIPGQDYGSLARDIAAFQAMDLDMIGVGPYLPHPGTPLGTGWLPRRLPESRQVPATVEMACKVVALARIVRPDANIPSTTALATLDPEQGRELGLRRGANVFMPNMTPQPYRGAYEIYPNKACIYEEARACRPCLEKRILGLGRTLGRGPGGRTRVEEISK